MLFEGKSQGFYAGLGVSYRINKHEDSYKDLDNSGKEVKDTPITRYEKNKGGFFSRIFKKKEIVFYILVAYKITKKYQ